MYLFPAIDLYEKQVVRLYKGDYAKMTVYSDDPLAFAKSFESAGAQFLHVVDLQGAKTGETPNFEVVRSIAQTTQLKIEIGGGIRSMDVIEKYLNAGVDKVILGTAAVNDPQFLKEAVKTYGGRIAVGVDSKDGKVAIHGWTKLSDQTCFGFCEQLAAIGVQTVICTDIAKDGAMQGTNRALYRELVQRFDMRIIASGGVSSSDDIKALRDIGVFGAILGKALYTGAVDIKTALAITGEGTK